MAHLLIMMLERVGVMVILGFLLAHMKLFRKLLQDSGGVKEKLALIAVFSLFSIISNYTGIEIKGSTIINQDWQMKLDPSSSIANTRIMGVEMGGLLGGPVVGFGVGVLAGAHRYLLGGSTAFSCALSSILAGLLTGVIGRRYRRRHAAISPRFAAIIGIAMESSQMLIILLFAKPFADAWLLVSTIAVPMIIVNGLGSFIFLSIIQSILRQEEQARDLQTHKVLLIADETLPYFRQGLNEESCRHVAGIIYKATGSDAVSLTDTHKILAHVGAASDHHIPSRSLITGLSKTVLRTGEIKKAKSRGEIACSHENCPLEAAIVLPLKTHGQTIGTLKMYFKEVNRLSRVEEELAEGFANIFSTQLELGEAELQSKLLQDAEIKALQAQVNPHFLFNAINTISALCRTDVEKARKLLFQLSIYFRSNLQGARQLLIPLEKEISHVHAYLSLEQARFPGKYTVNTFMEDGLEDVLVPPFVLQVLVENSLRHAFPRKQPECKVDIRIFKNQGKLQVSVRDNGKGISADHLVFLGYELVQSEKGTGTALYNINQRLRGLFGSQTRLHIESREGEGTKITFALPIQRESEEDTSA